MISPFYKFTPVLYALVQKTPSPALHKRRSISAVPLFLKNTVLLPHSSLSTRNVCNPGSGYDVILLSHRTDSRTHFTKAVIGNCFQPVTVSLFRHNASATLSVQSLSHIEYILCDIIFFVNQFPSDLCFKKICFRLDPDFPF